MLMLMFELDLKMLKEFWDDNVLGSQPSRPKENQNIFYLFSFKIFTLTIPHINPFGSCSNNGKWTIVMAPIFALEIKKHF